MQLTGDRVREAYLDLDPFQDLPGGGGGLADGCAAQAPGHLEAHEPAEDGCIGVQSLQAELRVREEDVREARKLHDALDVICMSDGADSVPSAIADVRRRYA